MNWAFLLACVLTVVLYEHVDSCKIKPESWNGMLFLFIALAMFVCGANL